MEATATRFARLANTGLGIQTRGSGISGRRESAQAQYLNGLQGMIPKKGACLVEVRPDEELPTDFCVSPRRILAPTALDEASAVALDYASALARRFGSELALLYVFEGSDYDQSSNIAAELRKCFSALRLRHLKIRVFLRPGPTGEQVKAVANALDADLIVTSCDYHRRFLSHLTHAETGTLRAPRRCLPGRAGECLLPHLRRT